MLVTLLFARARLPKAAFAETYHTHALTPPSKRTESNSKLCVLSSFLKNLNRVSSNSHTHAESNGERCPKLPSCSPPGSVPRGDWVAIRLSRRLARLLVPLSEDQLTHRCDGQIPSATTRLTKHDRCSAVLAPTLPVWIFNLRNCIFK